jgi:hypothetical protein
MAVGDITVLEQGSLMGRGSRLYNVAESATLINPGEPVARVLGGVAVTPCADGAGVVATDFIVGIAMTTSTNTVSVAGSVEVLPLLSDTTYLIAPKTAATWDTQSEYDALVGKRVTIDLTGTSYTLDATDNANNGCVVMPLDIAKYPGKVAFAFRAALSDLA